MSTYEYICDNSECSASQSGYTFDVQLPIAERDTAEVPCPVCGRFDTHRQVVPSKPPTCVMTVPMNQGGHKKERLLP